MCHLCPHPFSPTLAMGCSKAQSRFTLQSGGKRVPSSPTPVRADRSCDLCPHPARAGHLCCPLRQVSQPCPHPVPWLWITSPPSQGVISAGRWCFAKYVGERKRRRRRRMMLGCSIASSTACCPVAPPQGFPDGWELSQLLPVVGNGPS